MAVGVSWLFVTKAFTIWSCLFVSVLGITPMRTWDTLQHMAQFHGSNSSGPFTEDAIEWIASNFVAATVEKWQDLNNQGHSEEQKIISDLARIKLVNESVVTLMYNNLICYFP
jgi:hypothetical protein